MEQTIRAISLWQPWATAFCLPDIKVNETRSWKTDYKGPLLIHSTMKVPTDVKVLREQLPDNLELYLGCIVGIVYLKGCYGTAEFSNSCHPIHMVPGRRKIELMFGDWSEGRFAWYAPEKLLFDEPIPVKGQQGLWNYRTALLPGYAQEFISRHKQTV